MKKGFTLIELLAVIVILAIIALIATPIVLGIIEDTKNSSLEISSNMYKKALETEIAKIMMTEKVEDGSYIIDNNGNIKRGNKEIKVNVDNYEFEGGVVVIENGKIKLMSLKNNNELIIDDKIQSSDVWDGSIKEVTADSEGNYHIKKASELAWIASEVNNGNNFSGKTIYLENNIDLNNKEWTPIGNSTNKFSGTFEGNNNIIKNFKITRNYEDKADNQNIGLFGFITSSTIKNMNVYNAQVSGYKSIGAVIGKGNKGSIIDNVNVYDSKITGINNVGGVIGNLYTEIINNVNSYNSTVIGDVYVGGVIGYADTLTITNSYSNATINFKTSNDSTQAMGGIIGLCFADVEVSNIISESIIYGLNRVGGVAGHIQFGTTLENLKVYGKVEGINYVGGIVGNDSSSVHSEYALNGINNILDAETYATVKGIQHVGGVVGHISGGTHKYKNIYIKSKIIGNIDVNKVWGSKLEQSDYSEENVVSEYEVEISN